MKKERIWELDALRGLCMICMVIIHLFYDLIHFGGVELTLPGWFLFFRDYGHVLFVLISGICATLASRSAKRGLSVFFCGLLVSYVTLFMDYILGFTELRIWFGILHMLGACMMIYPLFKRLPHWGLALLGAAFVVLGFWLKTVTVPVDFLFPFGLRSETVFVGSDFFPLFPGLGWFLLGAALGKSVYRQKRSLLPRMNTASPIVRGLSFCGRHSLPLYLLHQPVLTLSVLLIFH